MASVDVGPGAGGPVGGGAAGGGRGGSSAAKAARGGAFGGAGGAAGADFPNSLPSIAQRMHGDLSSELSARNHNFWEMGLQSNRLPNMQNLRDAATRARQISQC